METGVIGRRQVLRGAGVAAGGVAVGGLGLASPAAAASDDDSRRGGLTGSYLVTRQDDGDPTRVQAVLSFADGDVFVAHDINPAGPPFTGTWERTGGGAFRATFWTGFPGEGGPGSAGGTIRVRARGEVDDGVLRGTYRVTAFDPSGAVVFNGTGRFRGRRIAA